MRTFTLAPLALLLASGCGAPWTTLVQSGPPSAIAGAQQLTYASDFSSLIMDGQPIAQILAQESPEEQGNIQSAFQAMESEFLQAFASNVHVPVTPAAGPPQPGEVRLTAVFTDIRRGARGPMGRATGVTVHFQFSVGGQVTDEAEASCALSPSLTRASRTRRMTSCAERLGRLAARYFNSEQQR